MTAPYFNLRSISSLSFRDLQERLLWFVTLKIRNGEYTERRLARVLGVSQPQLHNVLKGARRLQSEFADSLLRQFGIGVLDLIDRTEWPAVAVEASQAANNEGHDAGKHRDTVLRQRKRAGKEYSASFEKPLAS